MLNSHEEYVTFLSTLLARFDSVETVQFNAYLTSAIEGYSAGTIQFANDITLTFVEHIDFAVKALFKYGYCLASWQKAVLLRLTTASPHPISRCHASASQARSSRPQAQPHSCARPLFRPLKFGIPDSRD